MKYILTTICLSMLLIFIVLGLASLIFWGLGNLVILVFQINYTWTIWHGLVMALIFYLLKDVLSKQ